VPAWVTHAVSKSRLSSQTPYLGLSGYGASRTCAWGTAHCEVMEGCWRVPSKIVLTSRSADAGGSVKHVRRVGWLVFWQEAERGNVRFSFFSPKFDLLGLNASDYQNSYSDAEITDCQHLHQEYDESRSNFAFIFNVHRYTD